MESHIVFRKLVFCLFLRNIELILCGTTSKQVSVKLYFKRAPVELAKNGANYSDCVRNFGPKYTEGQGFG
jgi:hypothetical protein